MEKFSGTLKFHDCHCKISSFFWENFTTKIETFEKILIFLKFNLGQTVKCETCSLLEGINVSFATEIGIMSV